MADMHGVLNFQNEDLLFIRREGKQYVVFEEVVEKFFPKCQSSRFICNMLSQIGETTSKITHIEVMKLRRKLVYTEHGRCLNLHNNLLSLKTLKQCYEKLTKEYSLSLKMLEDTNSSAVSTYDDSIDQNQTQMHTQSEKNVHKPLSLLEHHPIATDTQVSGNDDDVPSNNRMESESQASQHVSNEVSANVRGTNYILIDHVLLQTVTLLDEKFISAKSIKEDIFPVNWKKAARIMKDLQIKMLHLVEDMGKHKCYSKVENKFISAEQFEQKYHLIKQMYDQEIVEQENVQDRHSSHIENDNQDEGHTQLTQKPETLNGLTECCESVSDNIQENKVTDSEMSNIKAGCESVHADHETNSKNNCTVSSSTANGLGSSIEYKDHDNIDTPALTPYVATTVVKNDKLECGNIHHSNGENINQPLVELRGEEESLRNGTISHNKSLSENYSAVDHFNGGNCSKDYRLNEGNADERDAALCSGMNTPEPKSANKCMSVCSRPALSSSSSVTSMSKVTGIKNSNLIDETQTMLVTDPTKSYTIIQEISQPQQSLTKTTSPESIITSLDNTTGSHSKLPLKEHACDMHNSPHQSRKNNLKNEMSFTQLSLATSDALPATECIVSSNQKQTLTKSSSQQTSRPSTKIDCVVSRLKNCEKLLVTNSKVSVGITEKSKNRDCEPSERRKRKQTGKVFTLSKRIKLEFDEEKDLQHDKDDVDKEPDMSSSYQHSCDDVSSIKDVSECASATRSPPPNPNLKNKVMGVHASSTGHNNRENKQSEQESTVAAKNNSATPLIEHLNAGNQPRKNNRRKQSNPTSTKCVDFPIVSSKMIPKSRAKYGCRKSKQVEFENDEIRGDCIAHSTDSHQMKNTKESSISLSSESNTIFVGGSVEEQQDYTRRRKLNACQAPLSSTNSSHLCIPDKQNKNLPQNISNEHSTQIFRNTRDMRDLSSYNQRHPEFSRNVESHEVNNLPPAGVPVSNSFHNITTSHLENNIPAQSKSSAALLKPPKPKNYEAPLHNSEPQNRVVCPIIRELLQNTDYISLPYAYNSREKIIYGGTGRCEKGSNKKKRTQYAYSDSLPKRRKRKVIVDVKKNTQNASQKNQFRQPSPSMESVCPLDTRIPVSKSAEQNIALESLKELNNDMSMESISQEKTVKRLCTRNGSIQQQVNQQQCVCTCLPMSNLNNLECRNSNPELNECHHKQNVCLTNFNLGPESVEDLPYNISSANNRNLLLQIKPRAIDVAQKVFSGDNGKPVKSIQSDIGHTDRMFSPPLHSNNSSMVNKHRESFKQNDLTSQLYQQTMSDVLHNLVTTRQKDTNKAPMLLEGATDVSSANSQNGLKIGSVYSLSGIIGENGKLVDTIEAQSFLTNMEPIAFRNTESSITPVSNDPTIMPASMWPDNEKTCTDVPSDSGLKIDSVCSLKDMNKSVQEEIHWLNNHNTMSNQCEISVNDNDVKTLIAQERENIPDVCAVYSEKKLVTQEKNCAEGINPGLKIESVFSLSEMPEGSLALMNSENNVNNSTKMVNSVLSSDFHQSDTQSVIGLSGVEPDEGLYSIPNNSGLRIDSVCSLSGIPELSSEEFVDVINSNYVTNIRKLGHTVETNHAESSCIDVDTNGSLQNGIDSSTDFSVDVPRPAYRHSTFTNDKSPVSPINRRNSSSHNLVHDCQILEFPQKSNIQNLGLTTQISHANGVDITSNKHILQSDNLIQPDVNNAVSPSLLPPGMCIPYVHGMVPSSDVTGLRTTFQNVAPIASINSGKDDHHFSMTLRSMAKYNKASQIQPSRSSENSITAAETSVKTNGAFQTRREPLIQAHDTSSQSTAITNTQSIQLSSVSSTPAQRVKMVSSLQREDVWEPKLVTAKRMLAKNQHQDTSNTSRYENNQDDSKVVTKKKSRGRKNLYFSIKPQQSLGIKTLRVTEGKKKGATFHDLLEATIIKCSERLQESQ